MKVGYTKKNVTHDEYSDRHGNEENDYSNYDDEERRRDTWDVLTDGQYGDYPEDDLY